MLRLTPQELLTTTRAVRKRLDLERPVELSVVRDCLLDATQAPTGSNAESWHFMIVQHPDQRAELAELYRKAFAAYRHLPGSVYDLETRAQGDAKQRMGRVADSAAYLAEVLHRVPLFLIPCIQGRFDHLPPPMSAAACASHYGSIFPAVWSFMLAARLRGLGSALTTLHLLHEKEAAEILDIPYAEVTQTCLLPVAYFTGETFKPAKRKPLSEVCHLDDWGTVPDFDED